MARYVVSPQVLDDLSDRSEGALEPAHDERRRRPKAVGGRAGTIRRSHVIVELDADYPGGLGKARLEVLSRLRGCGVDGARIGRAERLASRHNVFAELDLSEIEALASDGIISSPIIKVWRDEPLEPFLDRSIRTIKADASLVAFGADGDGIVVAVADSGIDGGHPHFVQHANLDLPVGLEHLDMTDASGSPLTDEFGHGTHVAGIVAGQTDGGKRPILRIIRFRDATGTVSSRMEPMPHGAGLRAVAPRCKLLSLKVLDRDGKGRVSALIAGLERLEEMNGSGRRMRVHCVNISLGYPFDPEWHAAGRSPLCLVVDRLSKSGVVVVAAAGNDGSALQQTEGRTGRQRVGVDQSINDPGNAHEAITVGATHAEAPHAYGVSHFSSRGPTADGRLKPDLVAPGERIVSCAAAGSARLEETLEELQTAADGATAYFREDSGTSMAAAHVSGAVASLLSIRGELIGRPDHVKSLLVGTCTDLKRKADFQGAGLLDLMRAIQAV